MQAEKIPDIRGLFERRKKDFGKEVIEEFITSNPNNPTKSRIPSIYGMTVFEASGAWSETSPIITIVAQGKEQTMPRTVAGITRAFKMLYDQNAISAGGESRKELETAALGYFLHDIESVQAAKQERATEGVKKK